MGSFSFNASGISLDTSREIIPAGTYNARAIESDLKPLKSGNGDGLSITFEIIDGPHTKRRIWASLNVKHNNPVAQNIGQQQLAQICHAVGMPNGFQDSSQLHNRPLKIRVKIRKDETYGDKNEISGYEALGSASAGIPPIATQVAAQGNPAASGKAPAPWAAKGA